jgi:hypothetical protein
MHLLVRFLACSTRPEQLRAVADLLLAAVVRSIKAGEVAAYLLPLAAPALEAQKRCRISQHRRCGGRGLAIWRRPGSSCAEWAGLLTQWMGFQRAHPL